MWHLHPSELSLLPGLQHLLGFRCPLCLRPSAVWIVVIRFQQVKDFGDHGKANVASIVLGFISSVGISVLGNFQPSVVQSLHLLGTFLAFFLGLAYFWVQLYLTYRAQPAKDRCYAGPVRAICCILCTVSIILMAVLHFTGRYSAAAICEWILVMLFFCLFGLFAAEFRHIDCHQLTVQKGALEHEHRPSTIEINGYVTNALS
ncbi:modulator of macroautophagy TMEM150B isoform 3-T5 [Acanthopagrus schlegelii]